MLSGSDLTDDPEDVVRAIIDGWEHDETDLSWLVAWGYDIEGLTPPPPDGYTGPCKIVAVGCYGGYQSADYVDDTWPNIAAAEAWIAEQYQHQYDLAHNEMGRPTYRIVAAL